MARWYARFDAGSGPLNSTHNLLRIGANSASGALIRDGLIASRSALHADAIEDIASVYRDGSKGTIAPGNLYSSNGSTFVSFSAIYTSSLTNPPAPGVIINADYSIRPTSSILSTDSRIGLSSSNGVGVSYTTFTKATASVSSALAEAQWGTGGGIVRITPYTRPGGNPFRTLHSIWHNDTIDYLAWNDFTPGTASFGAANNGIATNPATVCVGGSSGPYKTLGLGVGAATTAQFLFEIGNLEYPVNSDNDTVGFRCTLTSFSSDAFDLNPAVGPNGNGTYILDLNGGVGNHVLVNPFVIGADASGNGPVSPRTNTSSSWAYTEANKTLTWSIDIPSGSYTMQVNSINFYDETIPTNASSVVSAYLATVNGSLGTCGFNKFVVTAGESS
jgi:hypothetical protein